MERFGGQLNSREAPNFSRRSVSGLQASAGRSAVGGHCSVKMNAFRAATRLAPRAAARATGSFQQQTASSELGRVGRRTIWGRDGTYHHCIGGPPSNRWFFVTALPTDYGGGVVLRPGRAVERRWDATVLLRG